LRSICRTRISSPINRPGMSQSMFVVKNICLSITRILIILITSFMREANWYSVSTISSLPDSILEKSKISFMIAIKLPLACRMLNACSRTRPEICSRSMSSAIPAMAFMGVRISWLILAKKFVLALLDRSALSTASWRLVSSCMVRITPVTPPALSSLIGIMVISK